MDHSNHLGMHSAGKGVDKGDYNPEKVQEKIQFLGTLLHPNQYKTCIYHWVKEGELTELEFSALIDEMLKIFWT